MDYINNKIFLAEIFEKEKVPSEYILKYENNYYNILKILEDVLNENDTKYYSLPLFNTIKVNKNSKEMTFFKVWDIMNGMYDIMDVLISFENILIAWLHTIKIRNLLSALEKMRLTSSFSITQIKIMIDGFEKNMKAKYLSDMDMIKNVKNLYAYIKDTNEIVSYDDEILSEIVSISIEESYFEGFEYLLLDKIITSKDIPFCIVNIKDKERRYKVYINQEDIHLYASLYQKWLEMSDLTKENTVQFLVFSENERDKDYNYIRVEYNFDTKSEYFNKILIYYDKMIKTDKSKLSSIIRNNIPDIKLSNGEKNVYTKGAFTIKDLKVNENVFSDLLMRAPLKDISYIHETQKLFYTKPRTKYGSATKTRLSFFLDLFKTNIKISINTDKSISFERHRFRGCYKGISANTQKTVVTIQGARTQTELSFYSNLMRRIFEKYIESQNEIVRYYHLFGIKNIALAKEPTIESHNEVDYNLYKDATGEINKIDQLKRVNAELFSSNYTTLAQKKKQPIAVSPDDYSEYVKKYNVIRYPSLIYKSDGNLLEEQPDLTCGSHYYTSISDDTKFIGLKKSSLENKTKQPFVLLTYGTEKVKMVGGTMLKIGETFNIKWKSGENVDNNMTLYISRNSGVTFEKIGETDKNNYNWKVTGPETENAIVKLVSDNDVEAITGIIQVGDKEIMPKTVPILPKRIEKNKIYIEAPFGWGIVVLGTSSIGEMKDEAKHKNTQKSKLKPQRADVTTELPSILSKYIRDILEYPDNITFHRTGANISSSSILESVIKSEANDKIRDLYNIYIKEKNKLSFISKIRKKIAKSVSANICRQECYDMTKSEIREKVNNEQYFLDPKLYYRIIEEYFNVHIIIFTYIYNPTKKKAEINIETPRYLQYITRDYKTRNFPVLFLFKTYTRVIDDSSQIELIIGMKNGKEIKFFGRESQVLHTLMYNETTSDLNIQSRYNSSTNRVLDKVDVNDYSNISIYPDNLNLGGYKVSSQFIDNYGKCRAVTLSKKNKKISIVTSPMRPLNVNDEEEPFINEDVNDVVAYVKAGNGILTGVSTRLISNYEFVTGIWFELSFDNIVQQFYALTSLYQYSGETKNNDVPIYYHNNLQNPDKISQIEKSNYYQHLKHIFVQVLKILYFATKAELTLSEFFKQKTRVVKGHVYTLPYNIDPRIDFYNNYDEAVISLTKAFPTFFSNGKFVFNTPILQNKLLESMESLYNYIISLKNIYNNVIFLPVNHVDDVYKNEKSFFVTNKYQKIFDSTSDFVERLDFYLGQSQRKSYTKITDELRFKKHFYVYNNEFIIQNVENGTLSKAINVADTWNTYLVNLGYYPSTLSNSKLINNVNDSITDLGRTVCKLNREGEIENLDENKDPSHIRVLQYKNGEYAAILNINQKSLI